MNWSVVIFVSILSISDQLIKYDMQLINFRIINITFLYIWIKTKNEMC